MQPALESRHDLGPRMRIGELSRRTGVSPALLRAWETRYGLITPERSQGGTRLYAPADVDRVNAMQAQLAAGASAAQAAAFVAGGVDPPPTSERARYAQEMSAALRSLDALGADRALDALLGTSTFEVLAVEVLLPYLNELGHRWERGQASIAEEHLATNVLRARLLSLARTPVATPAGTLLLACPPGEQHDLPLVFLAAALARRGWRFTLLGANTPIDTIAQAAAVQGVDAVVMSGIDPRWFAACAAGLTALAAQHALLIAGPASDPVAAAALGARYLGGDPISAVLAVSAQIQRI